jgi:uncharacterized damage-inducible protein DinB
MTPEYFKAMYDYHYWANDRILKQVEKVSDADFVKPMSKGYGALGTVLVHMIAAEWVWRSRWDGVSPTEMLDAKDLPTLGAIRLRWRDEEKKMRARLAELTDSELPRVIRYKNTRGEDLARPLWQVLAQVANHGTQHRAEAAAMLTDLGFSPGNLDLTIYFDEQGKKE